ncbi:hypothetical protein B0J11DRAFT_504723 [Dendryphion nanum]|uniref:Uncharacterized protein n=1 Tax=Dendryphion nanum TaxID=256645 RepID=A0A9P9IR82_9PLEO|nr:hypothetical protein B0J11DRAFT_504723 [Dendryphion nanum]
MKNKPPILLREFDMADMGVDVPGNMVKSYQALENLCYKLFSKSRDDYELHIHTKSGACKGKVVATIWNSGSYFNDAGLVDGYRELYAHFKLKTSDTSTPRNKPSNALRRSNRGGALNGNQMHVQKSGNYHKEQCDDNHDEESYDMSKAEDGDDSQEHSTHEESQYPALPADATPENWKRWHEVYKNEPAPLGDLCYRSNWESLDKRTKRELSHARLINESFGVDAITPCYLCIRGNLVCRIYHPSVQQWRHEGHGLGRLPKTQRCNGCQTIGVWGEKRCNGDMGIAIGDGECLRSAARIIEKLKNSMSISTLQLHHQSAFHGIVGDRQNPHSRQAAFITGDVRTNGPQLQLPSDYGAKLLCSEDFEDFSGFFQRI